MTRTLTDAIQELMSMPLGEQFEILEELALLRDAAGQCIALYEIARNAALRAQQSGAAESEVISKLSTTVTAASLLREAVDQVVRTIDRARSWDANGKDKISIRTLHVFVDQLVRIAHDIFGDDPRVEQYRQAIRDRVKIPGPASDMGTTKLPSDDVDEMDASCPRHPPSNDSIL
jgi:hypothetical protein